MVMYIILGVVIVISVFVFTTYNSLVNLRNNVNEAFSTMDVYLKKRWDLIPNIVKTVKGYAEHETNTLKEVVEARNSAYNNMNTNDKVDINNKMSREVSRLMLLGEAYPELKANANFQELAKQLTKIEDEIANSRKYYNGTVRLMNNKIEMFPSNIVASILGFKTYKMFEANEEDRKNVKVEL